MCIIIMAPNLNSIVLNKKTSIMAKSPKSKRKKTKKSTTGSKHPEPPKDETKVAIEEEKRVSIAKDIRTITINLETYQNLIGVYPIADVKTEIEFMHKKLGCTKSIPVTDDKYLPINEAFQFEFDFNSHQDLDNLLSNPITFTTTQNAGTFDASLYEQLEICDIRNISLSESDISAISMYEAFTGEKIEHIKMPKKKKIKAESKHSKKSASSVKSKESNKSKKSRSSSKKSKSKGSVTLEKRESKVGKEIVYGLSIFDLIPLFYGREATEESLLIKPLINYMDERMVTHKLHPRLVVTITIDKPIEFNEKEIPAIMNFTLESIYNVPAILKPEMHYQVCTVLPNENTLEPICFTNPKHTNEPINEDQMKCWPNLEKIGQNSNSTQYKIEGQFSDVKNHVGEELETSLGPRLEFNYLKRNYLLKDGKNMLGYQFSKNRRMVVELFMSGSSSKSKIDRTSIHENTDKKASRVSTIKSRKSFRSSRSSTVKGKSDEIEIKGPYLHLMAIIDVSTLLYPGVKRLRVATKLRTFHANEALNLAGLEDSYFVPKPKVIAVEEKKILGKPKEKKKRSKSPKKKDKKSKKSKTTSKASKKSKKSKKSSKKSKKSSKKGKKDKKDTNLASLLPDKPEAKPAEEPSKEVYNENGKPCFMVIELELSMPINEKRELEDLHENLNDLIAEKIDAPKLIFGPCLSRDVYQETVAEILHNMHELYMNYLKKNTNPDYVAFIKYLKQNGSYQKFLTSLTNTATSLAHSKFPIADEELFCKSDNKEYQKFIAQIFKYLVAEMHAVLNKQLIPAGLEDKNENKSVKFMGRLCYAKEAVALGDVILAQRYYIERLCYNETDPDFWFDFAVYKMEMREVDMAFQCVQEALKFKKYHKNSLLLFGILLTEDGRKDEAETCFLTLLVQEPRWLEAWSILFLFYERYDKVEGMEMAMEKCEKYLEDPGTAPDYFEEMDDFTWTGSICPNTIFFRAAIILIKMRVLNWAENALAHELAMHYGIVNYLSAVICFYKKQYEHCLEHLEEAKYHHGSDYAVLSLFGHTNCALNRLEKSKENYLRIIEAFARPKKIHLVYLNCGRIEQYLGNDQNARKLFLLACKNKQTPFTWLLTAAVYYQQNDLLSAEECLNEANQKDHRFAEVWAYLTLVNLKLGRVSEATMCYRQVKKNKLKDEKLIAEIKEAFKKCGNLDCVLIE